MTLFEKLFQYYPHKKDGFMYEFTYIEQSPDGTRTAKVLNLPDYGVPFKETKEGEDYTTEHVKPSTTDFNKVLKVGFCILENKEYAREDTIRRVWISIMLKIVAEDCYMDTPISIHQYFDDHFVKTVGYAYVERRIRQS